MNSKKKSLIAICASVLTAALCVFAITQQWFLFGVGIVLFQMILLIVILHTRTTLSQRLYAVGKQLDRKIQRRGTYQSNSANIRIDSQIDAKKIQIPVSNTEHVPSLETQISLILRSEIFDQEWYELQTLGKFDSRRDACNHYLKTGRRKGLSPHPLFLPSWVEKEWSTVALDPLVGYLNKPSVNRTLSTHPLFDPACLGTSMLKQLDREWGALSTFLILARANTSLPYDPDNYGFRAGLTYGEVRDTMMNNCLAWRAREDSYGPLRGSATPPSASKYILDILDDDVQAPAGATPVVSIVLPTWNRAGQLRKAIDSVQGQSVENWELIVADDGSVDDTVLSVTEESNRDPRIKLVALSHKGVSHARNRAIEVATGKYVAFLDSDKIWDKDFLKIMIRCMEDGNLKAASAACEVSKANRVFYRSIQATEESLALGNSIDQTALVVERATLNRVGGFDETLRRAVDYDLILAIAMEAKIVQIPFVGVRYSEDDSDPNRISEAESVAWNFYVRDRRRWIGNSLETVGVSDVVKVSVIIDGVSDFSGTQKIISELSVGFNVDEIEFLLLLSNNLWSDLSIITSMCLLNNNIRFIYANPSNVRTLSINEGIRESVGERLFIMDSKHTIFEGNLHDLLDKTLHPVESVVHPLVVGPTRLIDNAGVIYPKSGSDPIPLAEGYVPSSIRLSDNDSIPGAPLPLLVNRVDAISIQGFETRLRGMWADIDFSQRLSLHSGGSVVLSRSLVVQQRIGTAFSPKPGSAADIRMFHELWPESPVGSAQAIAATGLIQGETTGFSAASFPENTGIWPRQVLSRPSVDVNEPLPQFRWSIKCAAPADDRSLVWGDFHFANSLADALRRRGQVVGVDYLENAGRSTAGSDDIVLNLRGLEDIALPSNTLNIMWIISHPELVTAAELKRYDRVYAASRKWSEVQSLQWGVEISPLLQCTDSNLFYPEFDQSIADTHRILFVGNSRKVYRPAPWTAAHSGFPISIYGGGWKGLVPDKHISGDFISNDVLRRYYSSAGVTLNDHWAEMRDQGFISNRIFDVIASGGRLITDDVVGLDDLFSSSIRIFANPLELENLLSNAQEEFAHLEDDIQKASSFVRLEHSFDARAGRLLSDATERIRNRRQE